MDPPPACSSLMGLLRPHRAVAPAPRVPTNHDDPIRTFCDFFRLKKIKGLAPHPWAIIYSAHWQVTHSSGCMCVRGGDCTTGTHHDHWESPTVSPPRPKLSNPLLRACRSSAALRAAGLHTHVRTHRTSSDPAYLHTYVHLYMKREEEGCCYFRTSGLKRTFG